jgi:hypothetical protein
MDNKTLILALVIIIWHWVADFVFQTEWQATNKSKNIHALLAHTLTYSLLWFPICMWIFFDGFPLPIITSLAFVGTTFLLHTSTDFLTSRLNTKLVIKIRGEQISSFEKDKNFLKALGSGNWHNFFVSVGFDQVLHYVQLFLTLYFLKS